MPRFIVIAVGADRPGVIAALSGVLVELGCNLSDTQMAVLQGYATMMIVVDAPAGIDAETLHKSLLQGSEGLDHVLEVRPLAEAPPPVPVGERWIVSVRGSDRPGVVFEVAQLLAEERINIVDLRTRLAGRYGTLTMQVDVPSGVDGNEVARRLDELGNELNLSWSMRPASE